MTNITIEDLIRKVSTYNNNIKNLELIKKAYNYAEITHNGQLRQSGDPYVTHPLSVAFILAEKMEADTKTIVAGLLHDVIEDSTKNIKKEIEEEFNPYVAALVDGVSKNIQTNFPSKEAKVASNTRKLLESLEFDIRAIAIKLADNLHNMRTLQFKPLAKQKENAKETKEIYVPVAYNIGTYELREELEDLSLKFLEPDIYKKIEDERQQINNDVIENMETMKLQITKMLNSYNISSEIEFKIKNIYGIYQRQQQGNKINDMHDLLALKVIVKEVINCYVALGAIHSKYTPANFFKDYIAVPKRNGYSSLHTTLFGEGNHFVQAQIKTTQMDRLASLGIMAYWRDPKVFMNDMLKDFSFYKQLLDIKNIEDDQIYFNTVQNEVLSKKICVRAPVEFIELAVGSSIIDLAYKINSEIGNTMEGAIVNNKFRNPEWQLEDGDVVKILTNSQNFGPNEEWIKCCKTPLAKRKILTYLNNKT